MASVNKVIVLGNIGRDPELRYLSNGDAVCSLSLATSRHWKDKGGEKQEETEWHRVTFFGRIAEIAGEYAKKGDPLYVEGRLRTRKYEKDGVEHYATEIVADQLQLLGSRSGERQAPRQDAEKPERQKPRQQAIDDDDIPF